ncbi:hypothetical protein ANN_05355 [Periplaneta americana]|uniref:Uncharacterized protein n=1 Tax=Periplaneta americana TaxID=6978 RepID=A0ABQ8TAW5_PERAM|nr:hypothetical protein ANN_05355 [Periplaneta americana]
MPCPSQTSGFNVPNYVRPADVPAGVEHHGDPGLHVQLHAASEPHHRHRGHGGARQQDGPAPRRRRLGVRGPAPTPVNSSMTTPAPTQESRIAMAKEAFNRKGSIFCGPLEKELRKRLVKCFVWSVVLYGGRSMDITRSEEKRLEAFEMWIWRRMERVKWTDRIRNEAVFGNNG